MAGAVVMEYASLEGVGETVVLYMEAIKEYVSSEVLAAVKKYVSSEVLELAGNAGKELKVKSISPRLLPLSSRGDEDIDTLIKDTIELAVSSLTLTKQSFKTLRFPKLL
jgi:hypothetical protein